MQEKSRERHLIEGRGRRRVVHVAVIRFRARACRSPSAGRIAEHLDARRRLAAAIVGEDGTILGEHDLSVSEDVAGLEPGAAIAVGEDPSHGDRISPPDDDHRAGRAIVVEYRIDDAVRSERDGKKEWQHWRGRGLDGGSATRDACRIMWGNESHRQERTRGPAPPKTNASRTGGRTHRAGFLALESLALVAHGANVPGVNDTPRNTSPKPAVRTVTNVSPAATAAFVF